MAKRKERADVPEVVAARLLFLSDRTCCVCRTRKPVQIHHLDENPANNAEENLAVLCFDCHRETQIRGGFDRKLNAEQVILYRDNWHHLVGRARDLATPATGDASAADAEDVELVTSLAEIYRETGELMDLILLYHRVGNDELRDKYIDQVLAADPEPWVVFRVRSLQRRTDLIPEDVVEAVLKESRATDWTTYARQQHDLSRFVDATRTYLNGVLEKLDEDNYFTAAFYLRELEAVGLAEQLFTLALGQAIEDDDLWWQVRALEELGWTTEVVATLQRHGDRIQESDDLSLKIKLAEADGRREDAVELRKQRAREGEAKHAFLVDTDAEPPPTADSDEVDD